MKDSENVEMRDRRFCRKGSGLCQSVMNRFNKIKTKMKHGYSV